MMGHRLDNKSDAATFSPKRGMLTHLSYSFTSNGEYLKPQRTVVCLGPSTHADSERCSKAGLQIL